MSYTMLPIIVATTIKINKIELICIYYFNIFFYTKSSALSFFLSFVSLISILIVLFIGLVINCSFGNEDISTFLLGLKLGLTNQTFFNIGRANSHTLR